MDPPITQKYRQHLRRLAKNRTKGRLAKTCRFFSPMEQKNRMSSTNIWQWPDMFHSWRRQAQRPKKRIMILGGCNNPTRPAHIFQEHYDWSPPDTYRMNTFHQTLVVNKPVNDPRKSIIIDEYLSGSYPIYGREFDFNDEASWRALRTRYDLIVFDQATSKYFTPSEPLIRAIVDRLQPYGYFYLPVERSFRPIGQKQEQRGIPDTDAYIVEQTTGMPWIRHNTSWGRTGTFLRIRPNTGLSRILRSIRRGMNTEAQHHTMPSEQLQQQRIVRQRRKGNLVEMYFLIRSLHPQEFEKYAVLHEFQIRPDNVRDYYRKLWTKYKTLLETHPSNKIVQTSMHAIEQILRELSE